MDEAATQDVSLDALIFFATHSLLIVAIAALVFFVLGLWVGHLTWAKFKRRARAYSEELQIQRREIANLKRRIAQAGGEMEMEPPPELTPLLSEPLFEEAKNPIAVAAELAALASKEAEEKEAEPPTVEETAPEVPAEPTRQTSLAKAVLHPAPPTASHVEATNGKAPPTSKASESTESLAADPKKSAPLTTEKRTAASNVEFPPPEPLALPLQIPEIPLLKPVPGRTVTRALARSMDDSRTSLLLATDRSIESSTVLVDDHELAVKEGRAKMDDKLGMIYLSRPDRHDDLTLLRGVGEGLSNKLQELGVYTFKQIAMWSEDQISEFDHRLLTKDRIRREHWVKQARNLHFLKYGEEVKLAVV